MLLGGKEILRKQSNNYDQSIVSIIRFLRNRKGRRAGKRKKSREKGKGEGTREREKG
jgi:hypothetical protein